LATAAAPLLAAPAEIDKFFDDFFEGWVRADPEAASAMRIFPAPNRNGWTRSFPTPPTRPADEALHLAGPGRRTSS
jgi:hypothetical protein